MNWPPSLKMLDNCNPELAKLYLAKYKTDERIYTRLRASKRSEASAFLNGGTEITIPTALYQWHEGHSPDTSFQVHEQERHEKVEAAIRAKLLQSQQMVKDRDVSSFRVQTSVSCAARNLFGVCALSTTSWPPCQASLSCSLK